MASPLLQPGSRVAGYEVDEMVGKGGMGEVYRARQLSMDRAVALKVLSPKLVARDPAFIEKFTAEAHAAGRLNHPNIIGVHDVGKVTIDSDDGRPIEIHYFSMEFVSGVTVKDLIAEHGILPIEQTGKIMRAMSEALVYAEAQRVVHRDIKPENIMVTPEGAVKLADLGLAEQVSDEQVEQVGADGTSGKPRKVMGTPMYMSPEQARGLVVGPASDQYSLGATLFHMLSGQPPYQGASGAAIMRSHVLDPVPDPAQIAEVPAPWRALCIRLLAKEPSERFATAADLKAAVIAAIAGETLVSRRSRVVRAPASAGRGIPPVAMIAVAAGVVVIGAVAWFAFARGGEVKPDGPALEVLQPGKTPAGVDSGLAAAKEFITGLGSDDSKAVEQLDRALEDHALSASARSALVSERETRSNRLRERDLQERTAQMERVTVVGQLIDTGDLVQATARLGECPSGPADKTSGKREEAAERLRQAVAAAGTGLAAAAGQADRARLAELRAMAQALPLADGQRADIEAACVARDQALTAGEAASQAQAGDEARWQQLAVSLAELRGSVRYDEFRSVAAAAASQFASAEARTHVEALAETAKLAEQAEQWLRAAIKARTPTVTIRIGRDVKKTALIALSDDEIQLRPAAASVVKQPRHGAVLPWVELLDQALPADARPQRDRYLAAFAWFWSPGESRAAAGRLASDALGQALSNIDRRLPALLVPATHTDGQVALHYEFLPGDARWHGDFRGDGLSPGTFGLRWKCDPAVERGVFAEAALPTLRWNARVTPPCRFEARLRLNRETQVAIAGVEAPGYLARLAFNLKQPSGVFVGTLFTGPDNTFSIGSQTKVTLDVAQPVTVIATVDAERRLVLLYNGNTIERDRVLPEGPLGFVLQIYQAQAGGSLELESLSITGATLVSGP